MTQARTWNAVQSMWPGTKKKTRSHAISVCLQSENRSCSLSMVCCEILRHHFFLFSVVYQCHCDLTVSPYLLLVRVSSHCDRERGTPRNHGVESQRRDTTWNIQLTRPHVTGHGLSKAQGQTEPLDWRDKALQRRGSSWLHDTSADWFKGSLQELNLKGQLPLPYFGRNHLCWARCVYFTGQKQNSCVFVKTFRRNDSETGPHCDVYLPFKQPTLAGK